MIGLINLPSLASALRSAGFDVVDGDGDWHVAARSISELVDKGQSVSVVVANRREPGVGAWLAAKSRAGVPVVILETTSDSPLKATGVQRLEVPCRVGEVLAAVGEVVDGQIAETVVDADGVVGDPTSPVVSEPVPDPVPDDDEPMPVEAPGDIFAEEVDLQPRPAGDPSDDAWFDDDDDLATVPVAAPAADPEPTATEVPWWAEAETSAAPTPAPEPPPDPEPAAAPPPESDPRPRPQPAEDPFVPETPLTQPPPAVTDDSWLEESTPPAAPVEVPRPRPAPVPAPVVADPTPQAPDPAPAHEHVPVDPWEDPDPAVPSAAPQAADPWADTTVSDAVFQPRPGTPGPTVSRRGHQLAPVLISIAGKGGVGKTSIAIFAAERAAVVGGLKVVLIDANRGQGDIATYLRLSEATRRGVLPTIYDAAISGRASAAIVGPDALCDARHQRLAPVHFGAVLAPLDEHADPAVVTSAVYRNVLAEARRDADLVVVDTQIAEAVDTSGIFDDVVVPTLREGGWALATSDLSSASVDNIRRRLAAFQEAGAARDRVLLVLNRVNLSANFDADALEAVFRPLSTYLGSMASDDSLTDGLNLGRIDHDHRVVRPILDAALHRVTGEDVFADSPGQQGGAGIAESLRRLFRLGR